MTDRTAQASKSLETYLNDHLAGSRAALALMEDILEGSTDAEFVGFVRRLRGEVEEDRRQLEVVMQRLGVTSHQVKQTLASIAEKVSRVKLLRAGEHEQLSKLLELETLSAGIWTKRLLWLSLSAVEEFAEDLDGVDLDGLAARAQRQLDDLEDHRLKAAVDAIAPRRAS